MSKMLWGIFFIFIGVVIGINSFGIADIDIFFNGWWTLFIIIPSLASLFDNKKEGKFGSLFGLVIGVLLLLASNHIVNIEFICKMIVPLIFIMIGCSLIFNNTLKRKVTEKVRERSQESVESIVATFSEQRVVKDHEKFESANLDAVFGSVFLDLRNASMNAETTIKASAIFGGVEIIVPSDINVVVKSTPIFGGVSNKTIKCKDAKNTIYIEAFALFGGVDIK